jgi:uncharacterized protein (DUF2126 family)/transglutaminase-like putative cysteine protease
MGTRVALNHQTNYKYDRRITLGPQTVRLRPAAHCRTPILGYSLTVKPSKHFINWQQDPYGNPLARLVFPDPTNEFAVEVDLIAELSAFNPFDFFLEAYAQEFPFQYQPELAHDLQPYLQTSSAGALLDNFLAGISLTPRATVSFLVDLNRAVRDEVDYEIRLEAGIQSSEATLERGRGSCRDSGWLLVEILRHLGLAARFVSGYLIQLASDKSKTDSADLHAWAEVFLPGAGWIGLDPTSGLMAGEGHLPLACTPDPGNAAPITGTVEPATVDFTFSITVTRVEEGLQFADPVSDHAWSQARAVAHKIDADLLAADVRLTMGGEPTFVGVADPENPQWNTQALGPEKRQLAGSLIRGLQGKLAPGALLHFGQGKWYPGEPLPRWALQCSWRADGVPVWDNTALIAQEERDYKFGAADAKNFIEALARRLEVSAGNIMPAFEDAVYYMWRERKLPANLDVKDSKLTDPREREELIRVFERGLLEPVGYVLPVRRRQKDGRIYWSSQCWFLRPDRLLLVTGDSPIGYRLPLDSLPWIDPDDIDYEYEDDPFAEREKLPPHSARRRELFDREPAEDPLPAEPQRDKEAAEAIRPALCVEVRQGRLHVFVPYAPKLTDYLDMIAAIEDTCAYLQKPVWLEGYPPPSDPRLKSFSVTPDPGVIEVNLPPAATWDELENFNQTVFAEAEANQLTAQKFGYDGKHTATGGGNHITLGGPSAGHSPLLRRPALLRSMVAFWQNHPSLSYLFSGIFIGPTSQYPRVDEARMDSLYELEIAFNQIPEGECPPWLVDRLFRNLLVDVTGNTHRAEFCIDKLYPPHGSGSRLGLLELRAFEMAPQLRMSLLQLLLIRALVAAFWKQPYTRSLVRWGTSLHDRFLLPYFAHQDFQDVLSFLHAAGYAISAEWFNPQWEFRFPKIGSVAFDSIELELRQALEPWHVLGEEASGGGTARTVDSSLERLQVKVNGLTAERYALVCNGRRVPLHQTGVPGEAVAGVRFRAWHPVTCLHPTIPVHAPLVFDILDLWNGRSIGGCQYHVVHPGGRNYTARPVNAAEAESRRQERFQNFGHTPGPMAAPLEETNSNTPMTLDLRWPISGEMLRASAADAS